MIKTLIVLFAVISTSFAVDCVADVAGLLASSEIAPLVGIVFVFNIVIIALSYLLGESLHMPQLVIFAKEEIYHLVFSAVLLVAFGGALSLSCSISNSFLNYTYSTISVSSICYTGSSNAIGIANCYTNRMVGNAESILKTYSEKSINYQMDSTTIISITLPLLGGSSTGLWAYKKAYSMQYDMVSDTFLVPALISLKMQKVILQFIDQIALQLLLPIAFFFRIFIPTRTMGNFMLGLVIGIYVIFPMLYALHGAMFDVVLGNCGDYSSVVNDHVFKECGATGSFWDMAKLIPQAFFLPNLAVAIFITFVSGIAKALRGMG